MNYLSPAEFDLFGLETATAESWIGAASALINSHCRRPTLSVNQYVERIRLMPGRNTAGLTYLPLALVDPATTPVVAARARYAVANSRWGDDGRGVNDLAFDVAQSFALPGTWTALNPAAIDFELETGSLVLPNNALGLRYNEVEITYNAGLATIPDEVKFACVQIVKNAQATPALNVRSERLDRMRLDYFADALLDASVRTMLAPYVAQRLR